MTIEQTVEILPDHRLVLDLPGDLPVGMAQVELTITPKSSGNSVTATNGKTAFGCLHRYADTSKILSEEGAWQKAVLEKHAKG